MKRRDFLKTIGVVTASPMLLKDIRIKDSLKRAEKLGIPWDYSSQDITVALCDKKGKELKGGGYKRAICNDWSVNDGVVENLDDVTFPIATKDWDEIEGMVVYLGDNALIDFVALQWRTTVIKGDNAIIPKGSIRIEFS